MKTLIVSPYNPYPVVFGGAIRVYHVLKMFASFSDVSLLSYRTWDDNGESARHLETLCERVVMVDGVPSQTKKKWLLQARGLLSTKTFQYYSFYAKHFQQALDEMLRTEFDYIVVEQSQMGFFDYRASNALKILDLHNIEHELLLRRARTEERQPRKAALWLEARKFEREELAICRAYDLVFTPSERERNQLHELLGTTRVESLPNSIDTERFALRATEPAANEITFVGATHVDANRDGLIYFMESIFPLIEQRIPDVHFTIVGGKPPAEIREYGKRPNVDVTGFVDDVRPYMEQAKVLVVPLRSGGGTRLKILEGLSFGVPTVSTSLGAEGIDIVHGKHALLADTPEQFAEQVVRVLEDAQLRRQLCSAGRTLVVDHYSWQAVGRDLTRYVSEPTGRSAARAMPLVSQ